MAASDNLGTICGIFPPQPILMMMALIWLFLGFHHIVIVAASLMGVFLENFQEWGMATSCQGSVCHEEWRDQFASCDGLHRATYRVRYLTIGIFGLIFGVIGLQGVIARNQAMVKSFLYFWLAMIALLLVLFIADEVYVDLCDILPMNMQLDVQMFITRERMAVMRAQGFKDLTNVRTERIKHLIGFEWNPVYASVYFSVLLIFSYCCWEISKYAVNVNEGPVGLGPNFQISTKPNAEFEEMNRRMNDAVQDYYGAVPHFHSFPQLEAGSVFPYIPKKSGASPSINYGTMGIPRPPPPID